jgi:hypothetical protein
VTATEGQPARRSRVLQVAFAIWFGGVAIAIPTMAVFDSRPGAAGEAPPLWPATSRIARTPATSTLILFLHPHCPCTRASLSGVEAIRARAKAPVSVFVLGVKPEGAPASWDAGPLLVAARRLEGVTVLTDDRGREAGLFGARTSGHVVLYGPDGRLRFSGGITGGRGQEGENEGRASLLTLLDSSGGAPGAAPVYGCSLTNDCPATTAAVTR